MGCNGFWACLCRGASGVVVLCCCACGDEAAAPLPVNIRSLRTDALPGLTAQAVVAVELTDAPSGACPLSAAAELPRPSARDVLSSNTGAGERLIDGPAASVGCRVQPLDSAEQRFYLDLRLDDEAVLPRLRVRGEAGNGTAALSLEVRFPQGSLLTAECEGQVETIVRGAVWLRSLACAAPAGEAGALPSCALGGSMIFENCVD